MSEPIMTCPACGLQVPVGSPFCPYCGIAVRTDTGRPPVAAQAPAGEAPWSAPAMRPPTQHRQRGGPPWLAVILAGVLVLAAVGVGTVLVLHRHQQPAAAPSPVAVATQAPLPTATEVPITTTTPPVATTTTPAEPTDDASALAELQQERTTDRSAVEALDGSWVPELSAKTQGLVANGVTYDNLLIWQDFQQQAAAHPGALLLDSSDFSTFSRGGFWVTVVPETFADPAGANAWCDSAGIGVDDCYAKLISHTSGPHGSTVLRK
jgi:hypothetical protein